MRCSRRWRRKACRPGRSIRVADVFADPQVIARGMRLDLADAAVKGGSVPSIRSPIVFDGEPAVALRASPELGADTADVLADPAWGGGRQAS